jgi:hypothetical protein
MFENLFCVFPFPTTVDFLVRVLNGFLLHFVS